MDWLKKRYAVALVLVLLSAATVAVYWPVLNHPFISYDDPDYVTENVHIQQGVNLATVQWALSTGHAGNWHPLTWLSHAADWHLYGSQPRGHHLTNLVIHVLTSLLLWALLQSLTGAKWRSALVAALFALHPLHVESVAWVAERKDVLSGFFLMLTLLAYSKHVATHRADIADEKSETEAGVTQRRKDAKTQGEAKTGPSRFTFPPAVAVAQAGHVSRFYLLSLLCFALGLMSKPMLVTMPFVLLLLDFWPLNRFKLSTLNSQLSTLLQLLVEKLPFFALSLASSVATYLVQKGAGAVSDLTTLPLEFRLSNAVVSYVRYALKTVWPTNLAVFYPPPREWPLELLAGAGLVLLVVTAVVLWRARRFPHLFTGWFLFVGMLVPVIGLVQVGQQAMADRYMYLPLIGLLLMVIWSVPPNLFAAGAGRLGCVAVSILLMLACGWITRMQVAYWQNSQTLFEHALAVTEDNWVAHNNLGAELLNAGQIDSARQHFEAALQRKPAYSECLVNLGLCLEKQGSLPEAIGFFERGVAARPNNPVAHYNLANALGKAGKPAEAEAQFKTALELKPDFVEALHNYGILAAKLGKTEEARGLYEKALQLRPDYTEARLNFGGLLAGAKKFDEAAQQFQAVIRQDPANADARFNLASVLKLKGDAAGAAAEFAEVCRLRPADLEARASLGEALMAEGKLAEALAQFQEIVRARPSAAGHYTLALLLDSQGQAPEALAHYREAIKLNPTNAIYYNDLGWLLATTSNNEVRNGPDAVELAQEACKLAGDKEPRFWGTLDAALAEAGRFEEAIATAGKTAALAKAAGQKEIADAAAERLVLYRDRKPFRTPPPASP